MKVLPIAFQRVGSTSINVSYEPTTRASLSDATASACLPNAK
ncbi:hypothetical protein SynBIOSU31_00977 [Synechococcus sp. BIOS-U3-1]|nr:hypothetical protein SynBIOSU31_00977 [Synechococcus sp. BIOS-U3-1]